MKPSRLRLAAEKAGIVAALIFFLSPALWLFAVAYKSARDAFSLPPTLLFQPTLDNFRALFAGFEMDRLILSSVIISGGSTILALLIGVPAAYALARSSWRYASALAYVFLAVRMVPPVATLIPFYLDMRDYGLLGTWGAAILLDAVLNAAFVVWMMHDAFRASPREIEEAAMADGCTAFGAFVRVALPAVRPGLAASALFCALLSWNDFLYASFLTGAETKPLTVALLSAYGTKEIAWGLMGALAHFLALPMIVLTLILNRAFVQGLTRGMH